MAQSPFDVLRGIPGSFPGPASRERQSPFDVLKGTPTRRGRVETPEREPGALQEFGTGINAGIRTLGAQFTAAGGVIAQAVGAEETAQEMFRSAEDTARDIQLEKPRAVGFEEAFTSPGNFVIWLSRLAGEQVPVMASILAGGGLAGVLGRLLGRGALSAAEATVAVTRAGGLGAVGTVVGGLGVATAFETGATASEQFGAVGKVSTTASLAAGIAKGALEVIVPFGLAKIAGIPVGAASGVLARVTNSLTRIQSRTGRAAAAAVGAAPIEAATELLQEAVDIGVRDYVDENFDALGPEGAARLLEAAVSGFFVGGIFGGAAGGVSKRPVDDLDFADFDPGSAGPDPITTPVDDEEGGEDGEGGEGGGINVPPAPKPGSPPAPGVIGTTPIQPDSPFVPAAVGEELGGDAVKVVALSGEPSQFERNVEFVPQQEAQDALATAEGGRDSRRLIAITRDKMVGNISATVADLPANIINAVDEQFLAGPVGSRIIFDGVLEAQWDEALGHLNEAIHFRNVAAGVRFGTLIGGDLSSVEEALIKAKQFYNKALDLGLIVTPRTDKLTDPGFTVINPEDGIREVTDLTINVAEEQLREPSFFQDDKTFFPTTQGTVIIAGVSPKLRLPGNKEKISRRFQIDIEVAIEAGAKLVSTISASWSDTFSLDMGTNAITLDEVETIVASNPLVSWAAGADKQKAVKALNALTAKLVDPLDERRFHIVSKIVAEGLILERRPKTIPDQVVLYSENELPFQAFREIPSQPAERYRRFLQHGHVTESQAGSLEGNIEFVSGGAYDRGAHKLGTARVVIGRGETMGPDWLQAIKKVEDFYNKVMQKMGYTDRRIIIYDRSLPGSGLQFAVGNESGSLQVSMPENQDQFAYIYIDTAQSDDILGIGGTAMHEFGHAIIHWEFKNLDHGDQVKILNAYNRSLTQVTLGKASKLATAFLGADRAESFLFAAKQREREAMGGVEGSGVGFATMGRGTSYWLNADEWFADQVSRYFLEEGSKPLTFVEKFFSGIAKQLKDLFGLASFNGFLRDDWKPQPEIKRFLDSIINRDKSVKSTGSLLQGGYVASRLDGEVENTEPLRRAGLNPNNIPHSPEGTQIDRGLKALGIPSADRKKFRALNDRYSAMHKWGVSVIQLAKENPHIQALARYVEWMDQWYNEKMATISVADGRIRDWKASMSIEMQDRFAKFLFDMDQLAYLSSKEQKDQVERHPTDAEFVTLVREHKLSPEAVAVYRDVRADFLMILDKIEEGSIAEAKRNFTDVNALQKELASIRSETLRLKKKPYFPHSRFGDFALLIKDAGGKVVYFEQFETKRAAEKEKIAVQKDFPIFDGFSEVGLLKIPEEVKTFRGMPANMLADMKSKLAGQGLLTDELRDWLESFTAELSPGRSFRKRLLKRKNIPGFSNNAIRSYASYMRSAANHVARIKFSGAMDESIKDMKDEMRVLTPGTDVTKRSGIISFVSRHKEELMNPGADWAQARSVAFIWYLGFMPASAALNFTQIPMVAYPYLAARFGDAKAISELRKAVMGVHRTYQNKTDDVTDLQLRLLDRAMEQGFINESMATELAATASNNLSALIPGSPLQRFISQTAHWGAWMFHHSEQINRRVVFRAGVELALANPNTEHLDALVEAKRLEFSSLLKEGFNPIEARAFLSGKDAVEASQFEYAAHARPRFMQGKKGLIFTFFMFMQNMLWFATPGRGRAGQARYWLMMLFAAGIMGLPGAEDLAAVAKWISREMFGTDFDPEKELRKFSLALLDDDVMPDMMLHGFSRVGFGLPWAADLVGMPFPKFDFSGNLSMGSLVPGLQELTSAGDYDSKFARATTDAAGATVGIAFNVIRAITDSELPAGDMKRWERAMPRSIKSMMKAARFAAEGRERDRGGATIVEFDASDPVELSEILFQAMGFTPTRLSRRWDRDRMQKEAQMFWTIRRQILISQFDHAFIVKDKGAEKDMIAAIRVFNNEVPFKSMGISNKQLRQSRKSRERSRKLRELGIPDTKGMRPLAAGIQELFPEVDEGEVTVEDASRMGR